MKWPDFDYINNYELSNIAYYSYKHLNALITSKSIGTLSHYLPDARVFIYGSCSRISSEKSNDLDMVVVSASFFGVAGLKRRELIIRILGSPTVQIDPICLTPGEFRRLFKSKSVYALSLKESLSEIIGFNYD